MIPASIGTAISFLLLIAPGAVWQWWRSRYRTSAKETLLTETARSVLISMAASLLAASILASTGILNSVTSELVVNELRENGLKGGLTFDALFAIFINSITACSIAFIAALSLWHGRPTVASMNVWSRAFSQYGQNQYLIVEQTNGTIWRGKYIAHDHDIDANQVDLLIGTPLERRRPSDPSFMPKDKISFTILNSNTINSIQVTYLDDDEGKRSVWKRIGHALNLWRYVSLAAGKWRSGSAPAQTCQPNPS